MPTRAEQPCNNVVSSLLPEYTWLCDPANRTVPFLESLHTSLHQFGRLTERQIGAVARIMENRRRISSLDDDDDPTPLITSIIFDNLDEIEDEEDEEEDNASDSDEEPRTEYLGPHNITERWNYPRQTQAAVWNQAQWVYNGEFQVSGTLTMKFKIHTIAESRNNPDIVGKRAVSVWQDGRWKAFAFVSTSGHLVPWRAWRGDEWVTLRSFARALLASMRDDDIPLDTEYSWYHIDHEDPIITWVMTRTSIFCRRCNLTFATHETEATRNGVHDEDCEYRRTSPFRSRSYASSHRMPAAAMPTLRPPVPPPPSEPALSELGTGWLQ